MWTQVVLLITVLTITLVAGDAGEIFDVTTIFDVGEPDVKGRVHSRTNALGLPLYNGNEKVKSSSQLPNITCDSIEGVCNWETKNWELTEFVSTYWVNVERGEFYGVNDHFAISFKSTLFSQGESNFFLTSSNKTISQQAFSLMRFNTPYEGAHTTVYYYGYCDTNYRSYHINVLRHDGLSSDYRCDHRQEFQIQNDDILKIHLGNDIRIYKIERTISSSLLVSESDYVGVKYISMTGQILLENQPVLIVSEPVYSAEAEGSEMTSPMVTPDSRQLCLVLVVHAPQTTIQSGLDILSEDVFTARHLLQSVGSFEKGWSIRHVNINLQGKTSSPVRLVIKKTGSEELYIGRISSCSSDGEEVENLQSNFGRVVDEKFKVYSPLYTATAEVIVPAEKDSGSNYCVNDGVLTTAGCACSPGFTGYNCQTGCGRNRFGLDCGGLCSVLQQECQGLLLCTHYTGCQCAPGYHGDRCTDKCLPGWYGNKCSQECGRCTPDSQCDIYTGECDTCEPGYLPPYCKNESVYYALKPELASTDYGTVTVTINPSEFAGGELSLFPELYQVQYREKNGQWKIYTTKSVEPLEGNTSVILEGLKDGTLYEMRVLLIDVDFNKYDGELVGVGEVLTKCDIPDEYDYKVSFDSDTTSLNLSWVYVNNTEHWCPTDTYEVSWKAGWKWFRKNITNENFTLTGFLPGSTIKFKVRAVTSAGFAPYSETILASTLHHGSTAVRNLRTVSRQSSSIKISWDPPRGGEDRNLQYTVSYKCIEQPACSPGCNDASEGQLTQHDTAITLNSLLPFSRYLVTVTPQDGQSASIYVATSKAEPTEVPTESDQKPVRTNTSVTVFWDQGPVCSSHLLHYNYQLVKESDGLKLLADGFTKNTNVTFTNLTASTQYIVKVFVVTLAGWNPENFLAINVSTSATVPEAVRNLTVYKRGRGMLGLRWAEPRLTYGKLKSFTVSYSLGQNVTSHTIEPTHCVVWPELYCHTIEGLRSNRKYSVMVRARNADIGDDGEESSITGITKESPPSAPEKLKLNNSSSTSMKLQWQYPDLANGIVRSFLVSVEETEKYDQDSCCQIYPWVETAVKEETQTYEAEVSGLHPASTYFVSVSAKTVGLGPSQSLVVSTRPPHLPLTALPRLEVSSPEELSWQTQEHLSELNNSDVYTSLVKTHLLLAVLNESQPLQSAVDSGVLSPQLNALLQQLISKPFYFIAEYNQEDVLTIDSSLEDNDSVWGRLPLPSPLISGQRYQLVAVQVSEYNSVYNVDLRFTELFTLLH